MRRDSIENRTDSVWIDGLIGIHLLSLMDAQWNYIHGRIALNGEDILGRFRNRIQKRIAHLLVAFRERARGNGIGSIFSRDPCYGWPGEPVHIPPKRSASIRDILVGIISVRSCDVTRQSVSQPSE